jgi:hypothetical protein
MISEGGIQDLGDPDREEKPVLLLHAAPQIDERQMPSTLPDYLEQSSGSSAGNDSSH